MSFITKNLKKVGIVNTILIAVCLILDGYLIGRYPIILSSPTFVITNVFEVISIIFGLVYAISGYKKDSAKYYKGFMITLLITRIVDAFDDLYITLTFAEYNNSYFTSVFKFAIVICIAILVFAKDFGKKKSLIVAYAALICDVAVFARIITAYGGFVADIVVASIYLILSCITTIFVEAKYIDKESRGVK